VSWYDREASKVRHWKEKAEDLERQLKEGSLRVKGKTTTAEHKQGKYTGYEVDSNTYTLAPVYQAEWEELRTQQEGLDMTLQTIQAHADKENARLAKVRHSLWVRISEDLGVPFMQLNAYYNPSKGEIIVIPSPEPEESDPKEEKP